MTDNEYLDAARLDVLEDRLVREANALCGQCNEPIHFHPDKMWVDNHDRHQCHGTQSNHEPRSEPT
jgi:hypothetical protein